MQHCLKIIGTGFMCTISKCMMCNFATTFVLCKMSESILWIINVLKYCNNLDSRFYMWWKKNKKPTLNIYSLTHGKYSVWSYVENKLQRSVPTHACAVGQDITEIIHRS